MFKHKLRSLKTKQTMEICTMLIRSTTDLARIGNVCQILCYYRNRKGLTEEEKGRMDKLAVALEERVQELGHALVFEYDADSESWSYYMTLMEEALH